MAHYNDDADSEVCCSFVVLSTYLTAFQVLAVNSKLRAFPHCMIALGTYPVKVLYINALCVVCTSSTLREH